MYVGMPFDKARRRAAKRKRTIGGDCNEPIERAATHWFDVPLRLEEKHPHIGTHKLCTSCERRRGDCDVIDNAVRQLYAFQRLR